MLPKLTKTDFSEIKSTVFPIEILLHLEVTLNQNMAKEFCLGSCWRVLTCFLTLRPRNIPICAF